MSWITILAMIVFGVSMILAFERKGRTWQIVLWRLFFVISPVVICFYPSQEVQAVLGYFLAVIFTLGYGLLCGLLFYGFLLLISWIFNLEMYDIYNFLLGAESDKK